MEVVGLYATGVSCGGAGSDNRPLQISPRYFTTTSGHPPGKGLVHVGGRGPKCRGSFASQAGPHMQESE